MTAQPVTALLLAANPVGTSRLQLDEELREILVKVRASEHRDAIRFVPWFATRPDDLLQTLMQYRPEIVHFSGHGSAAGELILTGDDGSARPVPAEALRRIFRVLRDNVRVVLLNACWSASQAEAIAESVDFTIGMERPIGDEAAITFAASFYRALGFGRSVREAFDLGTTAVLLAGIPEDTTPKLITRPAASEPAYLIGAPAPTAPDRPTLIVSGHTDDERPYGLRYATTRAADGRVHIEARDPYLDRIRSGGPLGHTSWESGFRWPELDVKVVNNTGRTVLVHEAVLRVGTSRTDPRPVPMIDETTRRMSLPLWNAGWGDMTDCVLRFGLAPVPGGPVARFESRIASSREDGDLRPYFAAAGADVDLWESLSHARGRGEWVHLPAEVGAGEPLTPGESSRVAPARRISRAGFMELCARAWGPFDGGWARLTGDLTYRCLDRDGRPAEVTHPIEAEFDLGFDLGEFDDLCEAALWPSRRYRAGRLRTDGSGYEVGVPISQSLAPGEADRFLIKLVAERSSIHDFTLTLRYNDGEEAGSGPVTLDLFVSRYEVRSHLADYPETEDW